MDWYNMEILRGLYILSITLINVYGKYILTILIWEIVKKLWSKIRDSLK